MEPELDGLSCSCNDIEVSREVADAGSVPATAFQRCVFWVKLHASSMFWFMTRRVSVNVLAETTPRRTMLAFGLVW
jgi:hypothetical protein